MTIFLTTSVAHPERLRMPVAPAGGARQNVSADPRGPLTADSQRPDAAAPLGAAGRWF